MHNTTCNSRLKRGLRLIGIAAAGALFGRAVAGNLRGTLIGGILGAAGATTVSLTVRFLNLPLREGKQLSLTLRSRMPDQLAISAGARVPVPSSESKS